MKTLKIILIGLMVWAGLSLTCYGYDIVRVTNTPGADENSYSVAIFGNTIYAIWRNGDTGELYFDKSTDLGKTWGLHRKVIGASSGTSSSPRTALSNKILTDKSGNIFIMYIDNGSLHLLKSTDAGENFINKGIIPNSYNSQDSDFAINETGTIIYAVKIGDNHGTYDLTRDIYIWKSVNGGDAFSSRRTIFSAFDASEIKVETGRSGSDVYVFLVDHRVVGNRERVDFARSSDYGENFEPLKSVFPGELEGGYIHWGTNIDSAIDANGKIYVSWLILPNWNRKPLVYLSESVDKGENFLCSQVNDVDGDYNLPAMCVDSTGDVYSAFVKLLSQNGDYNLYFDKRLQTGNFGVDECVGGSSYDFSRPVMASTSTGANAFIMWSSSSATGQARDLYCATFAIKEQSPFGVCVNLEIAVPSDLQDFNNGKIPLAIKQAGIDWVRIPLRWDFIEGPDKGSFHGGPLNWAPFDTAINSLSNYGLNAHILLLTSYQYGHPGNLDPTTGDDTAIGNWVNFVSLAVQRYKDKVKYWEIWNEENFSGSWTPPSAANYVKLLKATYPAIKSADPNAKVILGGLMAWGATSAYYPFLDEVYSNGGKDYFDIVAFHPYTAPFDPTRKDNEGWSNNLLGLHIDDVLMRMQQGGDANKPVWITEIGWPSNKLLDPSSPRGVTPNEQADYLVKAFNICLSYPQVQKVFWYALRDTGYQPLDDEYNYGLMQNNYMPKPSYGAYQGYCLALNPDVWTLNMSEMPWHANSVSYNSTGAAACQMILDYIRGGAGQPLLSQDQIYEYAKSPKPYGPDLTADEVDKALGHFDPYDSLVSGWADYYDSLPDGNPYQGYNYSVDTYDPFTDLDAMNNYIRDICHWMAFTVTKQDWWLDGELVARPNTPAAIPIYGSYDHWVAVKGCVTSQHPCPQPHTNPWYTPDFTVYGFWMKDPLVTGIGQDTYKTSAECVFSYFIALTSADTYNRKLLQVAEPPAVVSTASIEVPGPAPDAANLKFIGVEVAANNNKGSAPLAAMSLSASSASAQIKAPQIKKRNWRDLVDPHLLTDPEAVAAFEGAKMERPILVKRADMKNADYYLVAFDKQVKGKGYLASGVIMLDSTAGYFKEASWTKKPETLLKVNKDKAIRLVLEYLLRNRDIELKNIPKKPVKEYAKETAKVLQKYERLFSYVHYAKIELIWEPNSYSASPYRPYWKVDAKGDIWYVTQEEKVIPE